MIKLTDTQRQAFKNVKLCKLNYRDMFKSQHALGYTSRLESSYDVNVARDVDNKDITDIVLIHELGHVLFGHMDVNLTEELKHIQKRMKERKLPLALLRLFGGPVKFINVCMDFEVNSKLWTLDNAQTMKDENLEGCDPVSFGIPLSDNFRDYYEPMFDWMKKKLDELKEQAQNQNGEGSDNEDGDGEGSSITVGINGNSSNGSQSNGTGEAPDIIIDLDDDSEGNSESDSDSDDTTQDSQNKSSGSGSDGSESDTEDSSNGSGSDDFELDPDDVEKNAEVPSGFQEDLPDTSDIDTSELDDDMREEIYEEGYQDGNDKADETDVEETHDLEEAKDNADACTSVKDVLKAIERNIKSKNAQWGRQHGKTGLASRRDVSEEADIGKFLKSILSVAKVYQRDSMKHYNRGTRRNADGLLYTSTKMKVSRNRKKLGILLDVSGSMDPTSVLKALNGIDNILATLDPASEVCTWDTGLMETYSIRHLPEEVELGGGTDMASGLKYFAERDFSDVVIYSDFGTDIPDLNEVMSRFPDVKVYSILDDVGSYLMKDSEFQKYLKNNKKYLNLD